MIFQDKINLMTAYKVDKRSRLSNNNSDSYEFNSANKLFVDNALQVRQCLLDLFGEELQTLVRIYFIRLKFSSYRFYTLNPRVNFTAYSRSSLYRCTIVFLVCFNVVVHLES